MLLLTVCGLPAGSWAQERRVPVRVEGKTVLPLRVLARPFSNIYQEADESKGIVAADVPAFQAYYVYTRPKIKATETNITGWYEVGSDRQGTVLGWMRVDDVLEWQQNMTMVFTYPEGRKPVLMFESHKALLDLIKAPSDRRKQRVQELYTALESNQPLPADFPVRSIEPKGYIDISKQFYLMPILESAKVEFDVSYEARLLKVKVASAVFKGEGERDPSLLKTNTPKKVEMDIVFVMDTTNGMQPMIDATLDAVRNIARFITKHLTIRQSIHFGLWGYRDSLEIPGIEYLTKNFTPTLQSLENFEQTLQGVHEATVGSEGFEEDMFSGVHDAMTKTAWTPNALRFLVLVADAPSHAPGDSNPGAYPVWNASGQDEKTLRQYATDNHIWIAALHAREPDPQLERFHALAEKQLRTLASNPGTQDASQAAYWTVSKQDPNAFAQLARELAGTLVDVIAAAKQGQVPTAGAARTPGHAGLVQYLGRATEPQAPRDIVAWVVDKDLLDPAVVSLEPRLLINRRDLDELRKTLQDVMTAGRQGMLSNKDFFAILQTTVALVARGEQGRIRQAKAMVDLVPEFLQGLPYKSTLMALSNSLWDSWSQDQQDEFLEGIEARMHLYQTLLDASDRWIQLHAGDAADEYVYPLALEALP
jgi:hypothetical protein